MTSKLNQAGNTHKGYYIGDDDQHQRRDPFNKAYRITDTSDKWNESNKGKFEDFRRLALRFFESGPEGIKTMLDYAVKQQDIIDLNAKDLDSGEYKHKLLLDEVANAKALDKLVFN